MAASPLCQMIMRVHTARKLHTAIHTFDISKFYDNAEFNRMNDYFNDYINAHKQTVSFNKKWQTGDWERKQAFKERKGVRSPRAVEVKEEDVNVKQEEKKDADDKVRGEIREKNKEAGVKGDTAPEEEEVEEDEPDWDWRVLELMRREEEQKAATDWLYLFENKDMDIKDMEMDDGDFFQAH
jgi:hypothetical protein